MTTPLEKAVVRILAPNGETVGAGFVVTEDGLIATCAHVIGDASAGPGETVNFVFHSTGEERQAVVEAEWWRKPDAEDIAILKLIGELPEPVKPLPLGASAGVANHPFETIGFPPPNPTGGILGSGTILGQTKVNEMPVLQLRSQEVTGGFSGAPVWDSAKRRVVGMVTATADPDGRWRLAETAFITSCETLRQVCPKLQLADICPYRGLAAFTETDAEFFFGRERVAERLVESLRQEPRFLAVLGPSGSGKSSLVQAGLIPHLRRGTVPGSDRWEVLVARPADQLLHQLESQGLAGAPENLAGAAQTWLESHPDRERLVLVLDQFEELLVSGSEELPRPFITQLTSLLEAPVSATVVLVMRDDFYSRFSQEAPALLPWLEQGLVNVLPELTRAELQNIIEGPAHAVGLAFEIGLVENILKDALESTSAWAGQVGRSTILPLLEFALTRLWEQPRDGVLTHEAYETIGGVTGGLTRWADQAYNGLKDEKQQRLARRVLTDLVHLGDESQGLPDSRRRRPLESLYRTGREQEAVHEVVQRLTNEHLLVTGRDLQRKQEIVELIHDALLREWGRLQRWLKKDRRFLAWRQGLEGRLQAWVESAPETTARRDPGRLLRGRDLVEAEQWLSERRDDLRAEEQTFIEASLARARQVRRLIAGAVTIAFLVVSLLALLAWSQRNTAIEAQTTAVAEAAFRATAQVQAEAAQATAVAEADIRATAQVQAEERRQMALSRQLAAESLNVLETDPERAIQLAMEAITTSKTRGEPVIPEAISALHRAVQASRVEKILVNAHDKIVFDVSYSLDGKYLASGGFDGEVYIWDLETDIPPISLPRDDRPLTGAKINKDGTLIILADTTGNVEVWNLPTRQLLPGYPRSVHKEAAIIDTDLTMDGLLLVTTGEDSTTRIIALATGEVIQEISLDGIGCGVAFNADGSQVATGDLSGNIIVWDIETEKETRRFTHASKHQEACAVAFSPDNKILASGGGDMTTKLWSQETGDLLSTLTRHTDTIFRIVFSPDGKLLASAGFDNKANIYDVSSGELLQTLAGHMGRLRAVAFAPDGGQLASSDEAGEIRLWDVSFGYHSNIIGKVLFSPNGSFFASAGADETIKVWESQSEKLLQQIDIGGRVWDIDHHPHQSLIAAVSDNNLVQIWDIAINQRVSEFPVNAARAGSIAYSPDGQLLAVAGDEGVLLWDTTTQNQVGFFSTPQQNYSVSFSPDGQNLAVVTADRIIRVWDLTTGELEFRLTHEPNWEIFKVAFSPIGNLLATAGADARVKLWDATTGEFVTELIGHTKSIYDVKFSPDGKLLATAGAEPSVKVWDLSLAAETPKITSSILEFQDFAQSVTSVDFSPNGRQVIAAGADQVIHRYTLSLVDLIEEIEQRFIELKKK